jgi:hypothetical protein
MHSGDTNVMMMPLGTRLKIVLCSQFFKNLYLGTLKYKKADTASQIVKMLSIFNNRKLEQKNLNNSKWFKICR